MNAKLNILVVDSEPRICQLLHEYLSSMDNAVTAVTNGRDAIEAALKTDFDLAFLEPEINGLETALRLKKINPGIMIVMIPLGIDKSNADELLGQSCEILRKPFSLLDIEQIVLREEKKKTGLGVFIRSGLKVGPGTE